MVNNHPKLALTPYIIKLKTDEESDHNVTFFSNHFLQLGLFVGGIYILSTTHRCQRLFYINITNWPMSLLNLGLDGLFFALTSTLQNG